MNITGLQATFFRFAASGKIMDEEYGRWSHPPLAAGPMLPFNSVNFTGTEIHGVATSGDLLSEQVSAGQSRSDGLAHVVTNCPVVAYATAPQFEAAPDRRAVP